MVVKMNLCIMFVLVASDLLSTAAKHDLVLLVVL